MVNLKCGNFERQIEDSFHRFKSLGVRIVGNNDNLTHSDKLSEKIEMYLKYDISSYDFVLFLLVINMKKN
jgi:hypothetical protein